MTPLCRRVLWYGLGAIIVTSLGCFRPTPLVLLVGLYFVVKSVIIERMGVFH